MSLIDCPPAPRAEQPPGALAIPAPDWRVRDDMVCLLAGCLHVAHAQQLITLPGRDPVWRGRCGCHMERSGVWIVGVRVLRWALTDPATTEVAQVARQLRRALTPGIVAGRHPTRAEDIELTAGVLQLLATRGLIRIPGRQFRTVVLTDKPRDRELERLLSPGPV